MLRTLLSIALGAVGLYLGWRGHVIWTDSPEELWAIVTVNCVLWALAIAFESAISRVLRPVTSRVASTR